MPSYGEKQKSAGIDISKANKLVGERKMVSKDMTIKTTLKIDNCEYKGNPVLNANK
jgi:hypothetical protein